MVSCPSCPPCVVSYPEASRNIYCFQALSDWRWSMVPSLSVRESGGVCWPSVFHPTLCLETWLLGRLFGIQMYTLLHLHSRSVFS